MKRARDVSEQAGFRRFSIAILLAFLVGILIRIALAPVKIEKLVRSAIAESPIHENLVFANAEVSLADGPVPDLALVLNKVEYRLGGRCLEIAPIRARLVRVPLRWMSLFTGNLSAGQVKIEDLTVDLDDIKRDCDASSKTTAAVKAVAAPGKPVEKSEEAVGNVSGEIVASPIRVTPGEVWSEEQQSRIAKLVSGVRVTNAEVYFENRMKSVIIENATAKWRDGYLDVSTSLRFPPATVFGENLPTFAITGTARRNEMVAKIRADLNEGELQADAVFKPVVANDARELEVDFGLSFSDLPLSVVTPLLSKSKIVTGAFRPKFMWLDCRAHVKGIFSRLLVDNPVTLSNCGISGQVGKVSFAEATRLANGEWNPFSVVAEKLDVARVLETFDIAGPSGVFANFGQVNANVKLNGSSSAEVSGSLLGAVLRFAGGEGKALQPLSIEQISATLANGHWSLKFSNFKPEGGSADLVVQANVRKMGPSQRTAHVADVSVELKALKLNPRVEKVVFTGPVANISGQANIMMDLAESRLAKLRAALSLQELRGSELASQDVKLEAQLIKPVGGQSESEIELSAKAPVVEVLKTGHLYRLLQPALLGWEGEVSNDGKSLLVNRVAIKGRFRDNGFHWTGTNAGVGSILNLSSHGSVFRDHAINAELEARYPLASKLKWSVSGNWMHPAFANASPELGALLVKAGLPADSVAPSVPPRLLGIPKDVREAQ